jgi:hypothetical protein
VKDGESYRLATGADAGKTRYKAIYCVHNEYGESIGEDENGNPHNHPVVKELSAAEQAEYGTVTIDGVACTVKYTYTLPDDPTTIYRLLEPQNPSEALPQIRVKGYYTYNHYETAYYLQYAKLGEETLTWITETYEPNTIKSLTESGLMSHLTQRLTLEELLGSSVHENMLLNPIAHTTIDELPGAVNSLTIAEVFENDVYETIIQNGTTYFVDANGEKLYYNETDGKWYTKASNAQSERVLKGTWKYLLKDTTPTYVESETGTYVLDTDGETYRAATDSELTNTSVKKYKQEFTVAQDYKITEINELVDNMTNNIQNATLRDLHDDKIITLSDKNILTSDIKYTLFEGTPYAVSLGIEPFTFENGTQKTKLGDLTINEMLTYVSAVLSKV